MKRAWASKRGIAILLSMGFVATSAPAQEWTLPQNDGNVHEGVKSCVGAPCHGNKSRQGGRVWLNEGSIWRTEDLHSRAFDVLYNKRSQRMAKNLGLEEPAHEAKLCLDCHADFVPDRLGYTTKGRNEVGHYFTDLIFEDKALRRRFGENFTDRFFDRELFGDRKHIS